MRSLRSFKHALLANFQVRVASKFWSTRAIKRTSHANFQRVRTLLVFWKFSRPLSWLTFNYSMFANFQLSAAWKLSRMPCLRTFKDPSLANRQRVLESLRATRNWKLASNVYLKVCQLSELQNLPETRAWTCASNAYLNLASSAYLKVWNHRVI